MTETDGSTFKVPYTAIRDITPHSGADRMEIAWVYGFQVCVQKNKYQKGDKIIYVPIDSVLSEELETLLFPKDSKVKLHNRRVRQIRLRGLASQGMVIDPEDVKSLCSVKWSSLEDDFQNRLGITKYEPPSRGPAQTIGKGRNRNKITDNQHFRKFNGIDNVKWFPDLFIEGEEVIIQEKTHGSHIRFGKPPFQATTLWKKLKKWLGLSPEFECLVGSNNVQVGAGYKGYYGEDYYTECAKKYDVFSKMKDGEFVHGELYGDGIQNNYTYGCKPGERRLVIFDVRVMLEDGKQKWLNPEEVEDYAKERGFDFVPVLYRGKFSKLLPEIYSKGPSQLCPEQKVREGCVIKSRHTYDVDQNKKVLKCINEAYLDDKSNSDFH